MVVKSQSFIDDSIVDFSKLKGDFDNALSKLITILFQ